VKYCDDELFIDIFSRVRPVFKNLFWLFEVHECKFELLFFIEFDFIFGDVRVLSDGGDKLIWIEEYVTPIVDEVQHLDLFGWYFLA